MKNDLTKQEAIHIQSLAKRGQYQQALQKLAETNGSFLDPHIVLEEAKNASSVLHDVFEWDNKIAGEKYRLIQARILINAVHVKIDGKSSPAYFNTRVEIGGVMKQGYFPVARVMSDQEIHDAVLRDAIRDLELAQDKYKEISELRGIINQKKLDKAKEKLLK